MGKIPILILPNKFFPAWKTPLYFSKFIVMANCQQNVPNNSLTIILRIPRVVVFHVVILPTKYRTWLLFKEKYNFAKNFSFYFKIYKSSTLKKDFHKFVSIAQSGQSFFKQNWISITKPSEFHILWSGSWVAVYRYKSRKKYSLPNRDRSSQAIFLRKAFTGKIENVFKTSSH